MENLTLRDRIWGLIDRMPVSSEIILEKKIRPENLTPGIEHIKEFISWDMSNDFKVEFSSDYKKLRKIPKK